jgi:acetyl-CoA C-acetyltransferase
MAALIAGLPVTVAGNTVNRLCASGLQSIMDAARAIRCGEGMLYIAGGVESMTRAPFVMAKAEGAFSRKPEIYDSTIGWRFTNKALAQMYPPFSWEKLRKMLPINLNNREEQDAFALRSQEKYFAALAENKWEDEIVAVEMIHDRLITWFSQDEHPRQTSLAKLAALKPAFAKDGTVTAGNSSGINDGAAALLLASEEAVKLFNLEPLAKVISMAVAGVDPAIMGVGPVPATQKALIRANLNVTT